MQSMRVWLGHHSLCPSPIESTCWPCIWFRTRPSLRFHTRRKGSARRIHVGVSVFFPFPHPPPPCWRSVFLILTMCTNLHHIKALCLHFCSLVMFTLPLTIHVTIDLPPPKRRRTLTGSIVSTALSAALIGTAVGLTVYRL